VIPFTGGAVPWVLGRQQQALKLVVSSSQKSFSVVSGFLSAPILEPDLHPSTFMLSLHTLLLFLCQWPQLKIYFDTLNEASLFGLLCLSLLNLCLHIRFLQLIPSSSSSYLLFAFAIFCHPWTALNSSSFHIFLYSIQNYYFSA